MWRFKALFGHPTRYDIVRFLMGRKPHRATVEEIVEGVAQLGGGEGIARTTVAEHIQVLSGERLLEKSPSLRGGYRVDSQALRALVNEAIRDLGIPPETQ